MTNRFDRMLGLLTLAALAIGCLYLLMPFVTGLLLAVILTYSTWPLYVRLRNAVGGRRTLAAGLMMIGATVILVGPFVFVAVGLADSVTELVEASSKAFRTRSPRAAGLDHRAAARRRDARELLPGHDPRWQPVAGRSQRLDRAGQDRAGGRRRGALRGLAATFAGGAGGFFSVPRRRTGGRPRATRGGAHRRRARRASADHRAPHGRERGLWHPGHRPRAGIARRHRLSDRGGSRCGAVGARHFRAVGRARGPAADLDPRGALAVLLRLDRLGYFSGRVRRCSSSAWSTT